MSTSSCKVRISSTSFDGFFFNDPATTRIYTLSLHDALPISAAERRARAADDRAAPGGVPLGGHRPGERSEEHTSELQSRRDLVCRLLLEKKKRHHANGPNAADRPPAFGITRTRRI